MLESITVHLAESEKAKKEQQEQLVASRNKLVSLGARISAPGETLSEVAASLKAIDDAVKAKTVVRLKKHENDILNQSLEQVISEEGIAGLDAYRQIFDTKVFANRIIESHGSDIMFCMTITWCYTSKPHPNVANLKHLILKRSKEDINNALGIFKEQVVKRVIVYRVIFSSLTKIDSLARILRQ